MSIDQFNSRYGTHIKELGQTLPPPELSKVEVGVAKCIVPSLRVRKGPGTNYLQVESLVRNDIVLVLDKETVGSYEWYKIGFNQWTCKSQRWYFLSNGYINENRNRFRWHGLEV